MADLAARDVVRARTSLARACAADSSIELRSALASIDTWLRRQPEPTKRRLLTYFGPLLAEPARPADEETR